LQGGANGIEGADGDDGDGDGGGVDGIDEGLDAIVKNVAPVAGDGEIAEPVLHARFAVAIAGGAEADGDIGAAGGGEEFCDQRATVLALAEGGGYELEVEAGAFERIDQCPGVVGIVADIGIDDDRGAGGGFSPREEREKKKAEGAD